MKIIAADIGNSSINIGFFCEELFVARINSIPLKSPEEYADLLNKFIGEKNIDKTYEGVIISSVVPGHTDAVKDALKTLSSKEPLILDYTMDTGIDFQVKEKERLGTDRIAASVGACSLFGSPVAVLDFGTATTLNFVGRGNVYKGGAILPGIRLMKEALHAKTAQLPDIELSAPFSAVGRDTKENILSGIIYGTAGAADRIIEETEKAEKEAFKVVVTGGYSDLVAPLLKRVDHKEPFLVLKGLKSVYCRVS